jgi:hypothetical protein
VTVIASGAKESRVPVPDSGLLRRLLLLAGVRFSSKRSKDGMAIAELIYEQAGTLPEALAREVLDFTGYLREHRNRQEWRDLMNA